MNLKSIFLTYRKDKAKRVKLVTLLTMFYNFIWAISKIIFGTVSMQYFFCLSGASTLMIAFIKRMFYTNYQHENQRVVCKKSMVIGVLLAIIGIVYIVYMARLFFIEEQKSITLITSIAIATFSFGELGIAVYNLTKATRKKDILLSSLRSCNLVSAFFAIVLTQEALLSSSANVSMFNAMIGMIAGILAIVVGIIVIGQAARALQETNSPHSSISSN